jgi:hypothetical protein
MIQKKEISLGGGINVNIMQYIMQLPKISAYISQNNHHKKLGDELCYT